MIRNDQTLTKISFYQKIALIIFGVFLTVFILEAGLRLGGFVLLSIQEHRNKISISKRGFCRIMCLGESTTAMQYPSFLQGALTNANTGRGFIVIDKGIPSITTWGILQQLEGNLDRYNPDMVVAMMGINDSGAHMEYKLVSVPRPLSFIKSLRVCNLVSYIWTSIARQIEKAKFVRGRVRQFIGGKMNASGIKFWENTSTTYIALGDWYFEQGTFIEAEKAYQKAGRLNPQDFGVYIALGNLYARQGRFVEAEAAFNKALRLNQRNEQAYVGLGNVYLRQEKFALAEEAFNKAPILNQDIEAKYVDMGNLYLRQEKFALAEEAFNKALRLNQRNEQAYVGIGNAYLHHNKFSLAEEAFEKALELSPSCNLFYKLGSLYQRQGKSAQAENIFKKALDLYPATEEICYELGGIYLLQGKDAQAQEVFKKARAAGVMSFRLHPEPESAVIIVGFYYLRRGIFPEAEKLFKKILEQKNVAYKSNAYLGLGWIYEGTGNSVKAEEFFRKGIAINPFDDRIARALVFLYETKGEGGRVKEYRKNYDRIDSAYYSETTRNNYLQLKRILDKRKIKLVCVQYPLRCIEPLKDIFGDDVKDIIFVDNEKSFKEKVKQEGYKEYFVDMFAGDFGHCTDKGNTLLAKNIACQILKEAFIK